MQFIVRESKISGSVDIPGSKSHTIRALVLGLLAEGKSEIYGPLESSDTKSCFEMVRNFGAHIQVSEGLWRISGNGGELSVPDDVIDIGNSGTSLYLGLGIASLAHGYTVFTGDSQIRARPADALLRSITDLGGIAFSTRGNNMPPVVVRGRIKGGSTSVEAVTSQYLSSLLIASPLADGDTEINVPRLNEKPYVEMTLKWLDKLGISYENNDFKSLYIKGGQRYKAFTEHIPADFSSAAFFLTAAAVTGSELVLKGLDFADTQGDKEVVNILGEMGAEVTVSDRQVAIKGGSLRGGVFDLNSIPDSLPCLAVAGCFAEGETRLINVPQARLKETDRIKAMCGELRKMGADIQELPDGLAIRKSRLRGAAVQGHSDHRLVMALSVAGLGAEGETLVDTAESVSVTFPEFHALMRSVNADIKTVSQ